MFLPDKRVVCPDKELTFFWVERPDGGFDRARYRLPHGTQIAGIRHFQPITDSFGLLVVENYVLIWTGDQLVEIDRGDVLDLSRLGVSAYYAIRQHKSDDSEVWSIKQVEPGRVTRALWESHDAVVTRLRTIEGGLLAVVLETKTGRREVVYDPSKDQWSE